MISVSVNYIHHTVLWGLGDIIAQFIVPEDSGKLNWKVIILINYLLLFTSLNIHDTTNKTYIHVIMHCIHAS